MSNPKSSNRDEFLAILTQLLNYHKQTYHDVSNATGIGEQILKNAYNGRHFGAKTSRINALRLYLTELETGAPGNIPAETDEQRLARMEAEIRRLEKKVAAVVAALEGSKEKEKENEHAG